MQRSREIISFPEDYSIYDEDELEELEERIDEGYGTRYFRLPEQYDIRDNRIVEAFIGDLPAGGARDHLEQCISRKRARSAGSEMAFAGMIWSRSGTTSGMKHIKQIARDWCDANSIRYTE